jgi:hypothetical protein
MSKDTLYVKARAGLRIRQENGTPLPDEGASVPLNAFWRRRLRDQDVVAASAPRQTKKATDTAKKEA